jgi:hypothetical protein
MFRTRSRAWIRPTLPVVLGRSTRRSRSISARPDLRTRRLEGPAGVQPRAIPRYNEENRWYIEKYQAILSGF